MDKEFKSIKNSIIQEAMLLTENQIIFNNDSNVEHPIDTGIHPVEKGAAILEQGQTQHLSVAASTIHLLYQLSKLFQDKLTDDRKGKINSVDKKLQREISAKKQSLGIRME